MPPLQAMRLTKMSGHDVHRAVPTISGVYVEARGTAERIAAAGSGESGNGIQADGMSGGG